MPGRGRFWQVGALNDEIVEESDLVQALQTKVNAVGGGVTFDLNETAIIQEEFTSGLAQGVWYKQDQVIADGTSNLMVLDSSDTNTAGRIFAMIVWEGRISGVGQKVGFTVNNLATATYNQIGTKVKTGDATVGVVDDQLVNQLGFIQSLSEFEPNNVILKLYPQPANGLNGSLEENFGGFEHSRVSVGNGFLSNMDNVQIISQSGNNFISQSQAFLYTLNRIQQ